MNILMRWACGVQFSRRWKALWRLFHDRTEAVVVREDYGHVIFGDWAMKVEILAPVAYGVTKANKKAHSCYKGQTTLAVT